MRFLEALEEDSTYGYKKYSCAYQKLEYNILAFASFVNSFARIMMLLF